jgi:hypothetical protein
MDTTLVKSLVDGGIGVLAIAGLVFVIYQQLQVIKGLSELVNNNTKIIDQNTTVTQELKSVINSLCEKLNNKSDAV